jgi:hypothetical protein
LWRQEAVLGAFGFGGVEPSGDLDGAVGEDAALDFAGGPLRADEGDAKRPPGLGLKTPADKAWRRMGI